MNSNDVVLFHLGLSLSIVVEGNLYAKTGSSIHRVKVYNSEPNKTVSAILCNFSLHHLHQEKCRPAGCQYGYNWCIHQLVNSLSSLYSVKQCLCIKPQSHLNSNVSSMTQIMLQVLHTLKYIHKFYLSMQKKKKKEKKKSEF